MKGKKTGGRGQGTPNRLTKEIRTVLKDLVFLEMEQLPDRLNQLEPKDRIEALTKLLPYVLPKIKDVYTFHDED